jgi:hypothetical protein
VTLHRPFMALAATLLFAAPASAQQSSPAAVALLTSPVVATAATVTSTVVEAPAAGPTTRAAVAGVRVTAPVPVDIPVAPPGRRSQALMVVGVAALIVGAVVGGDEGTIVMIVGGVMGLVGLWNYVQ